ncbi:hypothetical protein EJ06DRAFT_52939 [Trichodelitschia bisporula]|uniref:Uncharacterized protein n=1 Tax=Trichodelitschia bisporula TaxID=703511 RepID=A0A6G1HTX2_9PEZI|nr:hypothetical protein EJ06DRAFT_52939 [Trichodelitschia bisporula]
MQASTPTPAWCYFSYIPHPHPHQLDPHNPPSPDFRNITPDPENHLLAARPTSNHTFHTFHTPSTPLEMDASKLLQLQTSAAYARNGSTSSASSSTSSSSSTHSSSASRPSLAVHPATSSTNSSSSSESNSYSAYGYAQSPYIQPPRCMRCQSAASFGSQRMICVAVNLYYCARCADLVGYNAG